MKKILSIVFVICVLASISIAAQSTTVNAKSNLGNNLSVLEVKPNTEIPQGLNYAHFASGGITFTPFISGLEFSAAFANHCLQTQNSLASFYAPVNLPDNSVAKYLEFDYANPIEKPGATVAYFEKRQWDGTVYFPASITASDTSTGVKVEYSRVFTETIDNDNFDYTFAWSTGNNPSHQQLCAMRIFYLPPKAYAAFLPTITSNAQK